MHRAGAGPEIEIGGAQCVCHDQEPTLVERAARDPKPLTLEIPQSFDRRTRRHHYGAERRREWGKGKVGAPAAFPGDPQPVRGDDIYRARLQAHGRRLVASKRYDVEFDAFGLVESIALNCVEDPTYGPELKHADRDLRSGVC